MQLQFPCTHLYIKCISSRKLGDLHLPDYNKYATSSDPLLHVGLVPRLVTWWFQGHVLRTAQVYTACWYHFLSYTVWDLALKLDNQSGSLFTSLEVPFRLTHTVRTDILTHVLTHPNLVLPDTWYYEDQELITILLSYLDSNGVGNLRWICLSIEAVQLCARHRAVR